MPEMRGTLTYIAIDVQLDVEVIRPDDSINAPQQVLAEEPKA